MQELSGACQQDCEDFRLWHDAAHLGLGLLQIYSQRYGQRLHEVPFYFVEHIFLIKFNPLCPGCFTACAASPALGSFSPAAQMQQVLRL